MGSPLWKAHGKHSTVLAVRFWGIHTKVIPQMREFNGTEPMFEAVEDYLKLLCCGDLPQQPRINGKYANGLVVGTIPRP